MSTPRMLPTPSLSLHERHALVPKMAADEYQLFVADVKARGVTEPIKVLRGTRIILDGRTRHTAATDCQLPAVPVEEVDPDPDDPDGTVYMLRAARFRRNLTTGQRAALGVVLEKEVARQRRAAKRAAAVRPPVVQAHYCDKCRATHDAARKKCPSCGWVRPVAPEVAKLPPAESPKPPPPAKSREVAAAAVNVSPRTLADAKAIEKRSPETFSKLAAGEITLPEAKRAIAPAKPKAEPKPEPLAGEDVPLLPCPFCGSKRVELAPVRSSVWCLACKAIGPTPDASSAPAEVKRAWNERGKK